MKGYKVTRWQKLHYQLVINNCLNWALSATHHGVYKRGRSCIQSGSSNSYEFKPKGKQPLCKEHLVRFMVQRIKEVVFNQRCMQKSVFTQRFFTP